MIPQPVIVAALLIFAATSLSAKSTNSAESAVHFPKTTYSPFFPEEGEGDYEIGPLEVDKTPVTNAEFREFLRKNPQWRRSKIKSLFAASSYLDHWNGDLSFDKKLARHPVTHVSWFAARAYCEDQGKRLLALAEWEAVSDAQNPENLDLILKWYSKTTSSEALKPVNEAHTNKYGLQGMHGLIWEWVEDFSSVIISGDSRGAGDKKGALFCGGASVNSKDPSQYATFMRYAHRSSLNAKYTGSTLGFRCVR